MEKNTYVLGRNAERTAELFYRDLGYEFVVRNFRSRRGEIDLLFFHQGALVVVEVKGRRRFRYDDAWYTRWGRKKHRLLQAMRWYLTIDPVMARRTTEFRLEIVFITQGRVIERYTDEPFCG